MAPIDVLEDYLTFCLFPLVLYFTFPIQPVLGFRIYTFF